MISLSETLRALSQHGCNPVNLALAIPPFAQSMKTMDNPTPRA